MSLRLKVKSGPLQGREYPIQDGAVIGRAETEIMINDPKVSGRHAKIEFKGAKYPTLIDLGSRNGIRVNGEKNVKVALTPGLNFRIGNTDFEVIEAENIAKNSASIVENGVNSSTSTDSAQWQDVLSSFAKELSLDEGTPQLTVAPFQSLVVLRAIAGPNSGQNWILGYGPRKIGAKSIDVILAEPDCPDIAFTLTPTTDGCRYQTQYSNLVRLNGNPISSELLYAGDQIHIGQTIIEVEYKK